MLVTRESDDLPLGTNILHANSFWQRMRGLLGRRQLASGEGLLLDPGGSLHSFGMRFPIDVVFLDRQRSILTLKSGLASGRICLAPRHTRYALELPSGLINKLQLNSGDRLCWD